MNYNTDNVTTKKIIPPNVKYAVRWSEYEKVNPYVITSKVPARPGIFELFYEQDNSELQRFYMERVWYGGLRAEIRRSTEPDAVPDPARREVLLNKTCFYRYTIIETMNDMLDLIYHYSCVYLPEREPPAHSGRYEKIFVVEDPEKY